MTVLDESTTDGTVTLTPGTSTTVSLDAKYADNIIVLVDDGSSGVPGTYDITASRLVRSFNESFEFYSATGSTARVHRIEQMPGDIDVTLTRPAAETTNGTYRVAVISSQP